VIRTGIAVRATVLATAYGLTLASKPTSGSRVRHDRARVVREVLGARRARLFLGNAVSGSGTYEIFSNRLGRFRNAPVLSRASRVEKTFRSASSTADLRVVHDPNIRQLNPISRVFSSPRNRDVQGLACECSM